ncbi:MAG: acyl-CoA dehydrogenase family protein [Xanthobacteraceae bacterium]
MDQRVTVDCVANARALAPALAAAAARIEAGRELPPDIVDALHEARLFRMLVPRSYGGDEVSPVAFMAAVEELAKADASTAWCVAQTSVCSTISSSLKPSVAAEIFKNDPRGVLAWGPSTSKNAKAIAEPGGFRVTGEWPFASGSRHATWLAAHSFVYGTDGNLRRDAAGEPVQKTFVVPRRCAVIKDVWHVIGLKGTGSDTYALTDVFVPEDCAVAHHALDPAERREHGPLYSFNIYQLFGSSFPAIALGIARAMLDAFIELAQTKTPVAGKTVLRDNPVIQSQVGVAESQLAAARTFFFAAWDEIWRAAQDDAVTFAQRVRLRMASIHASQQARQVAETAYLAAGATAVFESNPFERRFRDMHAVSQQAQAQFAIYEVIGRHFLGLPLQSSRFF